MLQEKELLRLKKEIDSAKNEIAELKGQEKALLSQLKDEWDCQTKKEADEMVKNMETELEQLKEEIQELSDELENEFEEE